MPPIFQAELDLGTLIYIILVFFWVIGNAFGKKKKGRQTPRIPSPDETAAERELREMLEKLAGKPQPVEEIFDEEDIPQAAEPVKLLRTSRTVATTKPSQVRPDAAAPVMEPSIDFDERSRELWQSSPAATSSFSSTLSSMASMFKTSGLAMPALRYALSSNMTRSSNPVLSSRMLEDKQQLRRIIAGRIVLGPPRALDPYRADTEATRSDL